jgi:hypothetical protein
MTSTLRIKRRAAGGAGGAPSSLAAAELAFNEQDDTLWYGKGNSGGNAVTIEQIGGLPGTATPLMDGTAAAGTGIKWAREDHRHPTDTTRVADTGDTMTGQLTIAPTSGNAQFWITAPTTSYALERFTYTTPANGACTEIVGPVGYRWKWFWASGAEAGSNAGSDFTLQRFDDAGTSLGNVLTFTRSTGLCTHLSGISFGSQLGSTTGDLSKHISLYGGIWGFNITAGQMNFVGNGAQIAYMTTSGLNLLLTPTAPTATAGTNTTQIATTAFVSNAVTSAGGGNVSNSGTPTSGQVAQWTDATHIQGVAASSIGALVYIGSQTASNSASLVFSSIGSTYDVYVFIGQGIVSATNAVDFQMLVSEDNGSTWKSTGYRNAGQLNADAGTNSWPNTTNGAQINLSGNAGNVANVTACALEFEAKLFLPASTTHNKQVRSETSWQGSAGTLNVCRNVATYTADTGAVNAVQFKMSSGNISAGTIRMYGIRTS